MKKSYKVILIALLLISIEITFGQEYLNNGAFLYVPLYMRDTIYVNAMSSHNQIYFINNTNEEIRTGLFPFAISYLLENNKWKYYPEGYGEGETYLMHRDEPLDTSNLIFAAKKFNMRYHPRTKKLHSWTKSTLKYPKMSSSISQRYLSSFFPYRVLENRNFVEIKTKVILNFPDSSFFEKEFFFKANFGEKNIDIPNIRFYKFLDSISTPKEFIETYNTFSSQPHQKFERNYVLHNLILSTYSYKDIPSGELFELTKFLFKSTEVKYFHFLYFYQLLTNFSHTKTLSLSEAEKYYNELMSAASYHPNGKQTLEEVLWLLKSPIDSPHLYEISKKVFKKRFSFPTEK